MCCSRGMTPLLAIDLRAADPGCLIFFILAGFAMQSRTASVGHEISGADCSS